MTLETAAFSEAVKSADHKQVPQQDDARRLIRQTAAELAGNMNRDNPPLGTELESLGRLLLRRLSMPECYLGYAMVAINNAFWLEDFLTVPYHRRLLLLPRCLEEKNGCGDCDIDSIKLHAEQLGYQVIVAEGTSGVLAKILENEVDGLLGVACLDSLEKSFGRITELGIPSIAVPLLKDGCRQTQAEMDELRALLTNRTVGGKGQTRSFIPLLRQTTRIFHEPAFTQLLAPCLSPDHPGTGALHATSDIAVRWLRDGGKRFRPFVTIASYLVARDGRGALEQGGVSDQSISPAVRRLAIAIETLHKASLIHDDIEDDDEFRYGHKTLHRQYGTGPAVNIGDYLIGLGYRLIAGESEALGSQCVCDILSQLSQAHLELCRGQGAELVWQKNPAQAYRAADVLAVYGLKTAPAFEAAMYAGLRAAGASIPHDALHRLARYLGEGFQIINDLEDWQADNRNKLARGLDAVANRPTILRALALEAGGEAALAEAGEAPPDNRLELVRRVYQQTQAFARTQQLLEKLRRRAIDITGEFQSPDLRELMQFLIRTILPIRTTFE